MGHLPPDFDDYPPYNARWSELIEALNAGDIGEVEFTELALEAGMSIEQIGKELEIARGEW